MYYSYVPTIGKKKEEKKETYIFKCGKLKRKKKVPSILEALSDARIFANETKQSVSLFREEDDGRLVFIGGIEHYSTDFFNEIGKEYRRKKEDEDFASLLEKF